jgi:translocation and assembly module TamB
VGVLNANDPAVFAVVQDTALARDEQLVEGTNPLLANLRANVQLRVERDTWVRSKDANVEVYSDGDLVIDVDQRRGAFTLEGVMSSGRGEYNFLGKRFEIRRGSATFIGTPELDPLLQATGEYEVRLPGREAMIIRLIIGGTALEPRLSLETTAQPPISQSDLLSYLAFSRSSSSLLQFGGSSLSTAQPGGAGLVGQTAQLAAQKIAGLAIGVAVSELEGNAARSLGADVFNITTADVPGEVSTSGVGAFLRGTEVQFGKYLTTDAYVGLQARPLVLVNPDEAALGVRFEYRMPLGLRLETSFEPRYQLRAPTLDVQEPVTYNVFGAFLIREWRF